MRTALVYVLLLSALVGAGVHETHAITVAVLPTSQDVALGGAVDVTIAISDLGDQGSPSLGTFDINVTFNPGIISFASAIFGDPVLGDQLDVAGLGSVTATTAGAGVVNIFQLSLDDPGDLDTLQAAHSRSRR